MNQQENIISEIKKIDSSIFDDENYFSTNGYLNRVYKFLNNIKTGKIYSVLKLSENPSLFILLVKLYILETNKKITFIRDDFKQFRKQP